MLRRWNLPVYRHITAHYMWAFDQLFNCAGYRRVVVLEDDMLVAPDLFAYFEATAKLLDQVGTSVFCRLRAVCSRRQASLSDRHSAIRRWLGFVLKLALQLWWTSTVRRGRGSPSECARKTTPTTHYARVTP